MFEGSKMYPTMDEFKRAFHTWCRRHPELSLRKAIEGFNEFTGLRSPCVWRDKPTEEQVERVRKLAGPYGDALLAIYLAKGGMHHGTGQ